MVGAGADTGPGGSGFINEFDVGVETVTYVREA